MKSWSTWQRDGDVQVTDADTSPSQVLLGVELCADNSPGRSSLLRIPEKAALMISQQSFRL